MPRKQCFKCNKTLPLTEFYKHPRMNDGRLGKCKACTKHDVQTNRKEKVEYYREYDRTRGSRKSAEDVRKYRKTNPDKYKAHTATNNAIRDGRLKKAPCVVCGREDVHGHHDNYARPLDVIWLCPPHHFERHRNI